MAYRLVRKLSSLSKDPTPSIDASVSLKPQTTSLVLHNACLAPGDLKKLCQKQELESLEIQYCYTDYHKKRSHEPKLLTEMLNILNRSAATLVSVRLRGLFPRHTADVVLILQALQRCTKLEEIAISVPEEARVPYGLEWMALSRNNPSLSRLFLESFDLMATNSIDFLVRSMENASGMQDLALPGCWINDKGLWKLVHELDYLKGLRSFSLPRCTSLSHVSLLITASLLQLNTHLQAVDLTGNERMFLTDETSLLEEEEVEEADVHYHSKKKTKKKSKKKNTSTQRESSMTVFLRSLEFNSTLTELRMAHCGIGDQDFKSLLEALRGNRKLSDLDLDFNQLTRRRSLERYLYRALPNLNLQCLSLRGLRNSHGEPCERPVADLPGLLTALDAGNSKTRRTLTVLHLDPVKQHNAIDDMLERNQNWLLFQKFQAQNNMQQLHHPVINTVAAEANDEDGDEDDHEEREEDDRDDYEPPRRGDGFSSRV